MLCYAMLSPMIAQADFTISGPTTVCPKGTYGYTANHPGWWGIDYYRWYVSYESYYGSISHQGTSSGSPITITFNSQVTGAAYLRVEAVDNDLPGSPYVLGTATLTVWRSLPSPAAPNGGSVVFCGPNETVTVISSPYIPYNTSNPSDVASCLFHCSYNWQAPGGWNFSRGSNSPSNSVTLSDDNNNLQAPGSVTNGNNGFVILSALFSQCTYDVNSSSSAELWVGTPSVSNGQANGTPANSPLYIPGGYANLSVNTAGGANLNWYVANGSGSLSSYGRNASISFNGFVRVIVESSNRCGNGGSWTFYLTTESGGGGYYRVGPNPAKDQVSVMTDYPELIGELIQDVTLYDDKSKARGSVSYDQLKKYSATKKSSIDINTKGLPRGTYFLHVKTGDDVRKHQVILE